MIDILQAPVENSILWDANSTQLKVKSYRGDGFYFRVVIQINDQPFITQNWSKDASGIAQQDLQLLYYNYFNHSFSEIPMASPAVVALSHLKKKVSITIQECEIGTTIVIDSIDLPDYHILFSERPIATEPESDLILLDEITAVNIPVNGKYRITFYSGAQDITYTIVDDNDVTLHTDDVSITTNGIHTLSIDASQLTTPPTNATQFLKVIINEGAREIYQKLNILTKKLYSIKSLYYRTDYGSYQIAYLYGEQSHEHEFEKETYLDNQLSPVTHYVEDMETIEIVSGNDLITLTPLLHAISISLDVKLWLDDLWTSIHCSTDKLLKKVERQYIYQETLIFKRNNFKAVETDQYIPIPDILDITYTIDENQLLTIPLTAFTTSANGFAYDRIRFIQPTANARYGYTDNTQVLFTNNPNIPVANFIPVEMIVSDILNVLYFPEPNFNGTPLDALLFQLGDGTIWSNPATLTVNVNDLNPNNLAPIISESFTNKVLLLSTSLNDTIDLNPVITDPENDTVTILWETINNAPFTFSSITAASTTLTYTGTNALATHQVKVTATDSNSNVSTLIYNITTVNFVISLQSSINFSESSGNITVYDVVISGLPQGETVEILSESATTQLGQAYRLNYLSTNEVAVSSYQRLLRQTYTSTDSNSFTIKMALDNISGNNDTKLFLKLENPSVGTIKEDQASLELNPAV